ncbi:hypothetical protein D3C80_1665030 [compost metagenome]
MSDPISSIFLPVYSQKTPFYGHHHETPNYALKASMWEAFLKEPKKQWNSGWIERNHIEYILLNKEYTTFDKTKLEKLPFNIVFENDRVTIYEVPNQP